MSSGADAAVVLAGGAGTRVGGRDTGLLEWRGATLVAHALQRLVQAGFDEIVVSANRNLDEYARLGRVVIADEDPGSFRGPLAGIARALGAVPASCLFTVPVDVPEWPLDLPQRLAALLGTSDVACAVA
ncbi:MAG TPA: NTP transferase domain-containing protein, partial [Candidatus Saccharimonadia bacterium]|nr:NTP transferase domain-containing protein [Candidatus Saccharimonadia bacterium]